METDQEFVATKTNNDDIQDLSEFIPGLYRLLDLCKDEGSNGLGMQIKCSMIIR